MRLTNNQLQLLIAIHTGGESILAGEGSYDTDVAQLLALRLIACQEPDDPGHDTTADGTKLVQRLREAAESFLDSRPEGMQPPALARLERHPIHDAMQIVGEEPFYMVANGICRQQDCRPEPALVGPAVSVYATERQANARAIEVATSCRGTHVFVLKSVAMYEVDPIVKPTRTFL
jgi:hypothetical protein